MSDKINSILMEHENKLSMRLKKRENVRHEKTEGGSERWSNGSESNSHPNP